MSLGAETLTEVSSMGVTREERSRVIKRGTGLGKGTAMVETGEAVRRVREATRGVEEVDGVLTTMGVEQKVSRMMVGTTMAEKVEGTLQATNRCGEMDVPENAT